MALQSTLCNSSHPTPLALIKTHLEIANRETDPLAKTEAIDNANNAVGDAERLMSQLLLLARIDATSRAELSAQTCNLSEITRGVCEDFVLHLSNIGRTDIDLGFQGEPAILVKAEKTLVQEVLRNLIDNSVEHGGSNLKIDVSVRAENGHGQVIVQDNGPGFEVKENSATEVQVGKNRLRAKQSGIGLTIVREILNLFGGAIAFNSMEIATGTIVVVSLDLARKVDHQDPI